MALSEAAVCGIPDFGPVVERRSLLSVARMQSPAVTVICAPPGYGKSVFAAQYAQATEPDHVQWISLYDSDICDDEWLGRVVGALDPAATDSPDASCLPQRACEASNADLALRARHCLSAKTGRRVHMVLDGASRVDGLQPLVEFAGMLRRHTAPSSRLTVTCRSIAAGEYVPDPALTWMVCAEELLFDRDEILRMLVAGGCEGDADQAAASLHRRFAGHPALTSLMLRHGDSDAGSSPPLDLVWHVQRLVAVLPEEALWASYGAALLREGTALELEECLLSAGIASVDWQALRSLAPLLSIEQDSQRIPLRFRMHGVMCSVLTSMHLVGCGEGFAETLRAVVTSHLARVDDFARLQSLLISACTSAEVAQYCEGNWPQLMRVAGWNATERLLSRIPAVRISSSAPLLLLRAVVLRESERAEEAALHASLSQRIAEADGDRRTQASAILLGVSASLEVADFVSAWEALGQIDGAMRDILDVPTLCLFESFRALLSSYRMDYGSAQVHLTSAMDMLDAMRSHTWEAVWSRNSVSGCLGQLQGRWDLAKTVLASGAACPAITPLQSLQLRANTAVAALELGRVRESCQLLEEVLHDIPGIGLQGMEAYALGTLSDALWDGNRESSNELYLRSQTVLAARRDDAASGGEVALRAMLCRSEGHCEESLTLAERAAAQLRTAGAYISLICLGAEIELAASLLALGDRWGARRIASRILADLQGSGAAMHLLLATLVVAEIERQEGNESAALALLCPHGEYIATGSANWRMAMYCRAFPGLLSLLTAAFGAEELPLRMLRLIPAETIAAAAACDSLALSNDDRLVIMSRAVPGSEVVASAPPTVSTDGYPQCHVRLFGGLEVTVAGARVPDESWRKRKVRLLFTMLASRCGQDIPRDVLLERLWPDMDEERARRNFYVTWSAIKRALVNGGPSSSGASMLRSSGGVCRITGAVRVDLQDFDGAIASLRRAESTHDAQTTLAAARSLTEIYRGELLPGDIYEEWFAETRERAKHDFCDAMVVAARAAEVSGDPDEALTFLRRAGVADPWREDIYQAMMRCQMVSGQRSRAIETYIACRGRLVEDLGIDPSAETTRLYEAVLAMESDA